MRLKHAYYITCDEVIRDADGKITELRCHHDPTSRGGWTPDGKKRNRETLHWVSAPHAVQGEVRLYEHLFTAPDPLNVPDGKAFTDTINPDSLAIIKNVLFEQGLADVKPETRYQFLRHGRLLRRSRIKTWLPGIQQNRYSKRLLGESAATLKSAL